MIAEGRIARVHVRDVPDLRLVREFTIHGLFKADGSEEIRKLAATRWAETIPGEDVVQKAKQVLEIMPDYDDPLPLCDCVFSDSEGRLWLRTLEDYTGYAAVRAIGDLEDRLLRKVTVDRRLEIKETSTTKYRPWIAMISESKGSG